MKFENLQKEVEKTADPRRAEAAARYFKTGKGEYGEGDTFVGLAVPAMRKIAYKYLGLEFADLEMLLKSSIHEHRFIALEILVAQFEKGDSKIKRAVYNFYLKNRKGINNWDLVDTSAPYIIGPYLKDKKRDILYKLAKSKNIWDKRVAILATFAFIRESDFTDALKISEVLLRDSHDLIHKAVGWMLREVGNKSRGTEEKFLEKHAVAMPRTMLRYAIEKFTRSKRKKYLNLTNKNG